MARDTLTGSRIRERRTIKGVRQADLARKVGISASYLNLIEHNRRRIGGKLLIDIASVLGVEPSMLTEGAEAALIATLREAAADAATPLAETDRADEFAGRFPGWAEVLAWSHHRIASLERTVETLSDRLTHDPRLAASLHEVLSTAAAIRSTASILAETGELEPEWRDRFHRNLNEDSARLADSSKALVAYLDDSEANDDRRGAPQEEVEAFMAAHGHHFPGLERGAELPDPLIEAAPELTSRAARQVARAVLAQYQADAAAMPLTEITGAIASVGLDPLALAARFGADLPAVFRRIAALPAEVLPDEVGLVICDASGSILFRKPLPGFALPRHGESCPLWPLFSALNRPLVPIRRRVAQLGRSAAHFDCLAVAWPDGQPDFDRDPVYRSIMLILPVAGGGIGGEQVQPVGSSCRVCPRSACAARREPSILSEGL
ncbi:helix-turn-helix transcriptional regulator [Pseudodonghicola flavimaris]|uniref:Short-chain fatty acyl-CoA regulator family protein n=1 Tax=Pseudodonghicola flavimaris TaxID=3050036 RepID=A0ABT7EYY1_9RHOB|nr:helix-turn-helix transcriptional regulator [Pseudodonghicola flavimaris]MDK3017572.1 short-chain fatty acyl-CoA regulator family protein [Pseudodonghicola flavimaris]